MNCMSVGQARKVYLTPPVYGIIGKGNPTQVYSVILWAFNEPVNVKFIN